MVITLIGIDAATKPNKTGIARAEYREGAVRITDVGSLKKFGEEKLVEWIRDADRALIAIDAPLGWPAPLAPELADHVAGALLEELPDQMFDRETDRAVNRKVNKHGLSVGADKIARTAHEALCLLGRLREMTNQEIHLAWNWESWSRAKVIEVYPGATLKGRGWPDEGYKTPKNATKTIAVRKHLVCKLAQEMDLNGFNRAMAGNDDLLDSVLCVLAGADFMHGDSFPPPDPALAEKEGWIWVKRPVTNSGG